MSRPAPGAGLARRVSAALGRLLSPRSPHTSTVPETTARDTGPDTYPGDWTQRLDPVYDPKWVSCQTAQGPVRALAFTLSQRSPNFTGPLSRERYRDIFAHSIGRYGSTFDYARQTLEGLRAHGIEDHALARLLNESGPA